MLQIYELYITTSSHYNYIGRYEVLSAYHPTVETVGFPSLHFVTQKRGFIRAAAQKKTASTRRAAGNGKHSRRIVFQNGR